MHASQNVCLCNWSIFKLCILFFFIDKSWNVLHAFGMQRKRMTTQNTPVSVVAGMWLRPADFVYLGYWQWIQNMYDIFQLMWTVSSSGSSSQPPRKLKKYVRIRVCRKSDARLKSRISTYRNVNLHRQCCTYDPHNDNMAFIGLCYIRLSHCTVM